MADDQGAVQTGVGYRLPFPPGGRVIELGGGDRPKYHPNIDARWIPGVDLVADLGFPLPIPGGEWDGVYCQYALEHVSWRRVRTTIAEMHRLLKPGGVAVVITANLREQCRVLAEAQEWNDDLISTVFGDQDYPGNTHQSGFSPEYATRLFKEAGFHEVKIYPIETELGPTDMLLEAYKSKVVLE
jgi:predicted SAM-dependent methyltransferase